MWLVQWGLLIQLKSDGVKNVCTLRNEQGITSQSYNAEFFRWDALRDLVELWRNLEASAAT